MWRKWDNFSLRVQIVIIHCKWLIRSYRSGILTSWNWHSRSLNIESFTDLEMKWLWSAHWDWSCHLSTQATKIWNHSMIVDLWLKVTPFVCAQISWRGLWISSGRSEEEIKLHHHFDYELLWRSINDDWCVVQPNLAIAGLLMLTSACTAKVVYHYSTTRHPPRLLMACI